MFNIETHWNRANGPGLLLLDEPTASLDLRHQLDLVAAVRRRAEGGTSIVAIVHDLNLAALFAECIVVLGKGRIAAHGALRETITEEVLLRVFGVASAVDRLPPHGSPFVLPHSARKHVGHGAAAD
jgi:iron complex transport system ATP-binding protein